MSGLLRIVIDVCLVPWELAASLLMLVAVCAAGALLVLLLAQLAH